MPTFLFQLNLSPDAYLEYYRGWARQVVVRSNEGVTLQFPASSLQRYVTPDGIHGRFRLVCDENAHLISLDRIAPSGSFGS
jgi:Protein of unknown function (DUF2835)